MFDCYVAAWCMCCQVYPPIPITFECHNNLLEHVIQPLIMSPSLPMVAEIETNIISCFDTISWVVDDAFPQAQLDSATVYHQVQMLDELATEKCV